MDPPGLRAANDLSRRGRETGLDCRVAAPEVRRAYLYLTVSTYCEWLVPRGSARNFARPGLTGPPGENGGALRRLPIAGRPVSSWEQGCRAPRGANPLTSRPAT